MMRIKKTKKLVFKKQIKFILFALLIFFAAISFYFLYNYYNPKEVITNRYNYKTEPNVTYKVYLKENEFYEEKYMPSGKQYAADLIDYIDIDFSYLYSGSDLASMNYDYDVEATIVGEYDNTDSETPVLWTKQYNVLDKQTKNTKSKAGFNIKQNVKVNYDDYNNVVANFREEFKLAILAHLNVKLNINYSGKVDKNGKEITGSDVIELDIPLSRTTVAIDKKIPVSIDKYLDMEIDDENDKAYMYIGYFVAVLDLIVLVLFFDKIFSGNKNPYIKKLDKILKDYADITIRIVNGISFEDKELIEITNFNDMLDIEEEFNSPIMVYEKVENRETWFIVINDNYAYRYILNILNAED